MPMRLDEQASLDGSVSYCNYRGLPVIRRLPMKSLPSLDVRP